MAMELVQIRLSKEVIDQIDHLAKVEGYSSRSEVIRDALRKKIFSKELRNQVGSIPDSGDSVAEVKEIRRRLSRDDPDFSGLRDL